MNLSTLRFSIASLALLTACGSSAGNGGAGGASTGTGTDTTSGAGTDTTSGSGTDTSSGGGTKQDNTKNSANLSTKTDSGQTGSVHADKPASASDASAQSNKLGAMNAGKILNLYISDSTGAIISVIIDTEKNPLPAKAIPAGEPNSGAWVSYVGPAGTLTSKDKGTIEITACPDKPSVAAVGILHDVVLYAPADMNMPGMAKSMTVNGTFNLVYFGGAGELACTIAPPATTGTDAGSTTTGGEGSSCKVADCDGGTNKTRNCCPYVPCLVPCYTDCASKVNACVQGCMATMPPDPNCPMNCGMDVFKCDMQCGVTCKVDAACNAKLQALGDCEQQNGSACQGDNQQSCLEQKCCEPAKQAF